MDLYEFQGKKLFSEYGIKVPKGTVVTDIDSIPDMPDGAVVKSQILSGGRGKAGGVKVCSNNDEVKAAVKSLLGASIKDHTVNTLLIEEKIDIKREFYFSIFLNRKHKVPSLIVVR